MRITLIVKLFKIYFNCKFLTINKLINSHSLIKDGPQAQSLTTQFLALKVAEQI